MSPAGTPAPTVECELCGRCYGTVYRGVSVDGTRGPWHHKDLRMQHEPVLYLSERQAWVEVDK